MKKSYIRRKEAHQFWLEIKDEVIPVLKKMEEKFKRTGDPLHPDLECRHATEAAYDIGVTAEVFEVAGAIVKIQRGCWTPFEAYKTLPFVVKKLVAPTIVFKFSEVVKVFIQPKYFSASAFYLRKNISIRGNNSARFCRWHNFLRWFARDTAFIIPKKIVGEWHGSPRFKGHRSPCRVADIHAENIAIDSNNNLVIIDW
jgi:hypothetical protein